MSQPPGKTSQTAWRIARKVDWKWMTVQAVIMTAWMVLNSWPGIVHLDPYPFPGLGQLISIQTVFMEAIILMATFHQTDTDRQTIIKDLEISEATEAQLRELIAIAQECNHDVDKILDVIQTKFPTKKG